MAETFSSRAMFSYMREGHYQKTLGIGEQSWVRCFLPDEHPDGPTVHGIWDDGIDGLSKKVHLIILGLPFETFWTEFSVSYIPEWKERYSDQVFAWGVNIAQKDTSTVREEVRTLVNTKLNLAA